MPKLVHLIDIDALSVHFSPLTLATTHNRNTPHPYLRCMSERLPLVLMDLLITTSYASHHSSARLSQRDQGHSHRLPSYQQGWRDSRQRRDASRCNHLWPGFRPSQGCNGCGSCSYVRISWSSRAKWYVSTLVVLKDIPLIFMDMRGR